jgi:hypothetical protein
MANDPQPGPTPNPTPCSHIFYLFSGCSCWGKEVLSHGLGCIHNNFPIPSTPEEAACRRKRRKYETCPDLGTQVDHFYVILPGKCGNCHPKLDVFGWLIKRNRASTSDSGIELNPLPTNNPEEKRAELLQRWETKIAEQIARNAKGTEQGKKSN